MKAPTERDEDRGFMTHAENMTGSALPVCIRDGVGKDSEYAKNWALYFSKFISGCECHSNIIFIEGFYVALLISPSHVI